MRIYFSRIAAATLLTLFSISANAITVVGTFLDDGMWSLIHGSASPAPSTTGAEHLRWDPGQSVTFNLDLVAMTLTVTEAQVYSLASNDGNATASFTLVSASMDLSGSDGFNGGTLDYDLSVSGGPLNGSYSGTFSFAAMTVPNFPFNSSNTNGAVFEMYLWGGDTGNGLGIDIGIDAPVPLPAPLLLFASGILGLGLTRRRR